MVIRRSALIAEGAGASRGVAANPWLINETEETKGLSFGDIKEQQQRIIEGNNCSRFLKQCRRLSATPTGAVKPKNFSRAPL